MSAKEKQGFSLYFLIAFGLAWLCQVGGCMALLQQKNAVLYQLALIVTMFCPLRAGVRALSRRQGEVVLEEMRYGDLTLHLSTYTLQCGAKSIHLGFKEYEVLRILMVSPHTVVPKEELLTKVWGMESDAEDNNVEVYISFLRKKFFYLGSRVGIGTVRKVGYRLEG